MPFETASARLWKRLTREERVAAATHFWQEPPPSLMGSGLAAIVAARKLRPQAARALPPAEQAKILASILDPGESLAGFLIAALHLGERRPLLRAFLDALELPHEDGMLKPESDDIVIDEAKVQAAIKKISADFPREQVELYLNALWLQDPDRWGVLRPAAEAMAAR
jgi:hypothetical protein